VFEQARGAPFAGASAILDAGVQADGPLRPSVTGATEQKYSKKGCDRSLKVVVKDPEEFEQALREFRRKVQEQGLVREMRRRAHYVPPAEARKIKSLRARRRRTR
jgi:small subunit ribosomal protein S21